MNKSRIAEQKKIYDPTDKQKTFVYANYRDRNFVVGASVRVNHILDKSVLLKALNLEIERNEGMRLRFYKDGKAWKQYIDDAFQVSSFRIYDLRKYSMDEALLRMRKHTKKKIRSGSSDIPFLFLCFYAPDGWTYLYMGMFHRYMDAYAISLTLSDLLMVYLSLSGLSPMPEPLLGLDKFLTENAENVKRQAPLKKEATEYYLEQFENYGEPLYASAKKNFVLAENRRFLTAKFSFHWKVSLFQSRIDSDFLERINHFCARNSICQNALFFSAFRLFYSAVNGGQKDISFYYTLDLRGKKSEKRLPVEMASAYFFRTVFDSDLSFGILAQKVNEQYMLSLRHSTYDFTDYLIHCFQNYPGYNTRSTFYDLVFSNIYTPRSQPLPEGWKGEGFWLFPKNVLDRTPIYLLVLDSCEGGLNFFYRYSSTLYQEQDIQNLHNGMVRILTRGMENPDLTVKELMEEFM